MLNDGDGGADHGPVEQEPSAAPIGEVTEIRAATEERTGERFDPTPYLRQLRGRGGSQDYLDVRWRLLWLRREHPDAEIVTEHVQIDESAAIFKATVRLPSGGMATGYGSETASDFGDFIEKAETKAIGRALNALGYGAQFGERGSEEAAEVVPPRAAEPAAPPARPAPARPVSPVKPAAASHDPSGEAPPPAAARRRAAPAPVDLAAERERVTDDQQPDRAGDVATTVAPEAAPTAGAEDGAMAETATGETGEPDLADYSWSLFWPWARGLGLNSRNTIEALTGQNLDGRSPAEVRAMILTARGER